jgi:hypothetical protein
MYGPLLKLYPRSVSLLPINNKKKKEKRKKEKRKKNDSLLFKPSLRAFERALCTFLALFFVNFF